MKATRIVPIVGESKAYRRALVCRVEMDVDDKEPLSLIRVRVDALTVQALAARALGKTERAAELELRAANGRRILGAS